MSRTKKKQFGPENRYTLTDDHQAQLEGWRDKWIDNAMSTKAMDSADRKATREAIKGLYRAANLEPPPDHRIVFVPSPFVARFAGGFASWIWWRRKNPFNGNDATDAVTDAATRAATDDATADATHAATDAATDAATRAATDAATDAATRAATVAATHDATDAATHDATAAATHDATVAATVAATRAATDAATDAATRDATAAATDAATDAATHDATAAATYDATDDAVFNTWYLLGGNIVKLAQHLFGAESVPALQCGQRGWRMWNGGNQYSGWCSYLSFFDRVCNLDLPSYPKWRHYEQAALHSGPRLMHEKFCIVSDRPEILLTDEANRPHCDTGPFCRWGDGSALYAVHGVRVPAWIIEFPDQITVKKIDDEKNAEIRRVMISRYGEGRYLADSGATKISSDECGELYRRELDGDEPIVAVRVINSSPEPDGSYKPYWIRVPPTITTAREAVAWSFGVEPEDYEPLVET